MERVRQFGILRSSALTPEVLRSAERNLIRSP